MSAIEPKGVQGSRRSHRKSRNGCGQCKKTRIKCNEQAPKCNHCRRRGIECDFENSATRNRVLQLSWDKRSNALGCYEGQLARQENVSSSLATVIQQPVPTSLDYHQRELFHHFMIYTSNTLRMKGTDPTFWCIKIPQGAMQYDFLLDTVLAFSALHRAYLAQDYQQRYYEVNRSLKLHHSSITKFTQAVTEITPENCEAAFEASLLSNFYSCGTAQIVSTLRSDDHVDQIINVILSMFKSITLFRSWQTRLKLLQIDTRPQEVTQEKAAAIAIKRTKLLCLLERADINACERRILQDAIYAHVAQAEAPTDDAGWTKLISPAYMELLQQRHPQAVLILAVFNIDGIGKQQDVTPWFLAIWKDKMMEFMRDFLGPLLMQYHMLNVS